MINQGNNVPDKTITIFTNDFGTSLNKNNINNLIDKPPKKRDWFTPHFYKCLPLKIGNTYGFIIKSEFDFGFIWNGENNKESIKLFINEDQKELDEKYPRIETHFGSGIITINPPFTLRTPPGVNLMTINPPNYIIPNITVMTGVVETDNLRRNFTFNLKIQIPNIEVYIPAGTPIAAFIPIPRYYADSFELKLAEDIFSQEIIDEENEAELNSGIHRTYVETNGAGKHYLLGNDVYGNVFKDHQTK